MIDEERSISIAVMREELNILQEWFQEKENEDQRQRWRIKK